MIVKPQRGEARVQPCLLVGENRVAFPDGTVRPLERIRDARVFAAWELVDRLARAGVGELVCWGEDPIRWRQSKHGDSHRRGSDVVIVKLDGPRSPDGWLQGLEQWANWLWGYGAAVGWSLGGTSLRLLKATLEQPLQTTCGDLPEPRWTLGGRQQSWLEPGSSVPDATELDMSGAYTRVIGGLAYGGVWRRLEQPSLVECGRLAGHGLSLLVRASVRLPGGLQVGPLPRRPRRAPDRRVEQLAPSVPYPVEGRWQGLWTWWELAQAVAAGAAVRPLEGFVHAVHTGARPFKAWLVAVDEGRAMPEFAGQLAKATGNALWGQFVIDDSQGLHVMRWNGSAKRFPVWASKGHQVRAWDLGELVTGKVRADLYAGLLAPAAGRMVCCHTDGGWIRGDLDAPAGWRLKTRAVQFDLLDQQHYRAVDAHGRERLVMSGVPAYRAGELFGKLWEHYSTREKIAC